MQGPGQLGRLLQMATKIRRLARNRKLGDAATITYIVGQFSPPRPRLLPPRLRRTVIRSPDDGRQSLTKGNRNEPRPRGPSRLDRRTARRGRVFRHQRGSHRLHCQLRPEQDQSRRCPGGRKRRSGSFTIDTVHDQLISGSPATPSAPPASADYQPSRPAAPTRSLQDCHPDNWLPGCASQRDRSRTRRGAQRRVRSLRCGHGVGRDRRAAGQAAPGQAPRLTRRPVGVVCRAREQHPCRDQIWRVGRRQGGHDRASRSVL